MLVVVTIYLKFLVFFTPGGNLVGPNHPGFGGTLDPYYDPYGIGIPNDFRRGRGNRGRGPPGARFDPFGPPGGGFGNPNNDHLPPPGFYS